MTVLRRELPPSIRANPPGRGPSVARGRRGLSNRACTVRGSWAASGWEDMHSPTSFQLRGQGNRIRVCQRSPEEADQLAGERHHGDGGALPVADEMPIPPVESERCLPGVRENARRLPLTPAGQGSPEPRWVAGMPVLPEYPYRAM